MELNLKNFNIRRSSPKIKDNYSLPKNVERYIIKAQGLIGVDIFNGDKIKIINIEGGQICEVSAFESTGKNNQSIIGKNFNNEASFFKWIGM